MSRRNKRKLPLEPIEVAITSLSHDGRGVAEIDGKKVFVHGALPGERVRARLLASLRRYDEAEAVEVLQASPRRVQARCAHFGVCGGCVLQHLDPRAQIEAKQDTLLQNLERIGKVSPLHILEPLTGPQWNYRRKARLSVRYVVKKERLLIGFRERQGRFVAEMSECHVLDQRVARLLPQLVALANSLDARDRLPQIEVACGDRQCALVMRHMDPLSQPDVAALTAFARENSVAVLLQPGGPDTVHTLEPRELTLDFALPEYGLVLEFGPSDFIQVNADLNRKMIHHALELMQPEPSDSILDLYCGLGNFTLPLARRAGRVTGVEGDAKLVEKARANAARNGIENAAFHVADLAADVAGAAWLKQGYDKILIDPPRSGAEEILSHLAATTAHRLVYVSCHPASLARDAGILLQQHGFSLQAAGVMDMFPHTAHVESIAWFERKK
ncbi:MAG TPA: 23S rRNA (uracil(1939)-C(5))-methyltransferase RlmD [Xanthomonadales bacterium]|nr:23S rRNA (uracil(1939)-C(5))-methyltransferase RlmD [Xanthomonadales bacterium]